jgi:hypothetical protein
LECHELRIEKLTPHVLNLKQQSPKLSVALVVVNLSASQKHRQAQTPTHHPPSSSNPSTPNPKMPATTSETIEIVTRTVSVAPLVLLSVADHYGRSTLGTKKRVVGVLLGQNDSKGVRVSNSFGGMFLVACVGSGCAD